MCVCISMYVYVYVYVCVCVCMYICTYTFMYILIYTYMYLFIYVYVCTHTQTQSQALRDVPAFCRGFSVVWGMGPWLLWQLKGGFFMASVRSRSGFMVPLKSEGKFCPWHWAKGYLWGRRPWLLWQLKDGFVGDMRPAFVQGM